MRNKRFQPVVFVKNKERQPNISLNDIDLADSTLSAFMSDGKAYGEVSVEMIDKINSGKLIVTEFHIQPLGNVIYIEPSSVFN